MIETEISARIRATVFKLRTTPVPLADLIQLLQDTSDVCDRFYNGMMNWKEAAQAKDKIIAELNAENAGLLLANRDCLDHFNALKADYDALIAAPVAAQEPECKSCAILRRYEKTARERGYAMGKAAGNSELARVQELLEIERRAHAETNTALTAEISRLEAQLAAPITRHMSNNQKETK